MPKIDGKQFLLWHFKRVLNKLAFECFGLNKDKNFYICDILRIQSNTKITKNERCC